MTLRAIWPFAFHDLRYSDRVCQLAKRTLSGKDLEQRLIENRQLLRIQH